LFVLTKEQDQKNSFLLKKNYTKNLKKETVKKVIFKNLLKFF